MRLLIDGRSLVLILAAASLSVPSHYGELEFGPRAPDEAVVAVSQDCNVDSVSNAEWHEGHDRPSANFCSA